MSDWTRVTCHCGRAELRVRNMAPLATAQRCDCSFCRRRQAANVTVALDDLQVVRGETLTLYTFGTHTAQHWFCSVCGIYTHHRRRSDPNVYGVNIGCIEGVNPADLGPIPWSDGVNHPSDRQSGDD